jgi:hypothetical protein
MYIIHRVRSYFQKPMVRKCVDGHIRTIVVSTGGKLIRIYFLYLFSATTHLRQGKKVSILVPGDVNSGPVASRRGLLEAVSIVR